MDIRNVTLPDMLAAREKRAARQRELLGMYPAPLICFTMNIAGPVKNSDLILRAWREGFRALRGQLSAAGMDILHSEESVDFTGNEAFLSVAADARKIKALAVETEERHPLGRLFDMDVLGTDGEKLERPRPRRCLLCGNEAAVCASRRLHAVEELQTAAKGMMESYFSQRFAEKTAGLAGRALLYELAVTPKPGLVDRHNNGAHRDMHFYTFLDSVSALTPWFAKMTAAGIAAAESSPEEAFASLRFLGTEAEAAMRAATGNVNTHKGAVFSLGLLCGALGRLYGRGEPLNRVCAEVGVLAQVPLRQFLESPPADTAGGRQFLSYGLTGARGEAAKGFPTARETGLPVLKRAMAAGKSPDEAGCEALLRMLAAMDDTNLIARSGRETQLRVRAAVADGLKSGFSTKEAERLDRVFIEWNLSPGGGADMLAVCWLLWFLECEEQEEER